MSKSSKPKLLWLQSITCNGNTQSFFTLPDFIVLMNKFEIIYHPILNSGYTLADVTNKDLKCDILILEGSFKQDGMKKAGQEILATAQKYAKKAKHIITAGSCATFGGIFRQYDKNSISGFCFNDDMINENYNLFRKKLISIPGCPAHPRWIGSVLSMILTHRAIPLDDLHRPLEIYGYNAHSGCPRSEYFEWKIDSKNYGYKEGCLFYEYGCQAPYTHANCNKILWNEVSSKTRAGTPCFGCTEPSFPKKDLWHTPSLMGIPASMPVGIPRRAYLTLAGIAKSFSIKRLNEPIIKYKK
ncbi:MAG: hydrogenase [Sulfurovaceae bacterium]|nr:hydrogenase [Sulfurovaceae bacterium]